MLMLMTSFSVSPPIRNKSLHFLLFFVRSTFEKMCVGPRKGCCFCPSDIITFSDKINYVCLFVCFLSQMTCQEIKCHSFQMEKDKSAMHRKWLRALLRLTRLAWMALFQRFHQSLLTSSSTLCWNTCFCFAIPPTPTSRPPKPHFGRSLNNAAHYGAEMSMSNVHRSKWSFELLLPTSNVFFFPCCCFFFKLPSLSVHSIPPALFPKRKTKSKPGSPFFISPFPILPTSSEKS